MMEKMAGTESLKENVKQPFVGSVFRDATVCRMAGYQGFDGICRLHLRGTRVGENGGDESTRQCD
jgi:hypothetical protein